MIADFIERNIKHILILPLVLLVLGLALFPSVYGYYLSVNDVNLSNFQVKTFNGLENFLATLGDMDFRRALGFSALFAVCTTVPEVVLGLGIALWFNRRALPGKGALISLMLLPIMVSPALLGIMFRLMLNEFVGVLAYYLKVVGLPGAELLSPQYVFWTLVAIDVVQWTPFTFLILYSALQTVSKELYEAASVDGANPVQLFRYITVPTIAPFIAITAFLRVIDSFKVFDMIYVLTGGGPGTITTSISIYIYRMAFNTGDLGRASAASILLLLLLSVPLAFALRRIVRRDAV